MTYRACDASSGYCGVASINLLYFGTGIGPITFDKLVSDPDPITSNPASHGSGWRFFAESRTPEIPAQRTVAVKIQVGDAQESRSRFNSLYLKSFDVNDPTPTAQHENLGPSVRLDSVTREGWLHPMRADGTCTDPSPPNGGVLVLNLSDASPDPQGTRVFPDAQGNVRACFTVTQQPGDNFRIAVAGLRHYLDSITVGDTDLVVPAGVARSDLLTVWRTLHVQVAGMKNVYDNYKATGTITDAILGGSQGMVRIPSLRDRIGQPYNISNVATRDPNDPSQPPVQWIVIGDLRGESSTWRFPIIGPRVSQNLIVFKCPAGCSPQIAAQLKNRAAYVCDDDDLSDDDGDFKHGDNGEAIPGLDSHLSLVTEGLKRAYVQLSTHIVADIEFALNGFKSSTCPDKSTWDTANYWSACLVNAYQFLDPAPPPPPDPRSNPTWGDGDFKEDLRAVPFDFWPALTAINGSRGQTTIIFQETIRDLRATRRRQGRSMQTITVNAEVAHELGHVFVQLLGEDQQKHHDEGRVMAVYGIRSTTDYANSTITRIRRTPRVH